MPTFTLRDIEVDGGTVRVAKLVVGTRCHYDKFAEKYRRTQHAHHIGKLDAIFERLARGQDISAWRKPVQGRPSQDKIIEWEIFTGRLRVYYFVKPETGAIIVLGNIKEEKTQRDDINTMRRLKNQCYNEI